MFKLNWRRAGLVTVCGAVAVTALATPAHAEDNAYVGQSYCGTTYSGASPAEDPFGALNDMGTAFYDDALENSGLSQAWCEPYHVAIDAGAGWVVRGTTLGPLSKPVGQAQMVYKGGQWVYETVTGDQSPSGSGVGVPATIPAVGPTASYEVAWTNGLGLWLRGGAGGDSATLFVIPEGTWLAIQCQVRGESVSNGQEITDLWDRVTVDGVTGFVSDAFVDTGVMGQVAPTC